MAQARGTPGRIALLGAALARHHASRAGADARVVRAVERLVASHGTADVGALAREVATTPRHLQRLFARDVGVSPKHLARIRRVQHVFAAWRDRPRAWAQVAAECGYVDQAHLARDMRAIAGGAPAGLVASMTAFTRAFTPLGTGARRVGWPDASPRRRHAVR
ncbi:MAG: helix-turn-helix domain-containing protein [Gemmatimonadetes bacterium]|nr:helix-turn-helix domain-containing protein [Gemmatimonadota bacterium]